MMLISVSGADCDATARVDPQMIHEMNLEQIQGKQLQYCAVSGVGAATTLGMGHTSDHEYQ